MYMFMSRWCMFGNVRNFFNLSRLILCVHSNYCRSLPYFAIENVTGYFGTEFEIQDAFYWNNADYYAQDPHRETRCGSSLLPKLSIDHIDHIPGFHNIDHIPGWYPRGLLITCPHLGVSYPHHGWLSPPCSLILPQFPQWLSSQHGCYMSVRFT